MPKIAFFEIEEWEKPYLRNKFDNILFFKDTINKVDFKKIKDVDIISVFIYSRLDRETLNKFNNLKLIATRSTGFDHIDLQKCMEDKITICNVPFYGENTVPFSLLCPISSPVKTP